MTTSALLLNQRLSEQTGDWIAEVVTTNIAANTTITSTHFNKWDSGSDGAFKDWWIYITDKNNAGEDRIVSASYNANASAVVRGASFSADTVPANVRLHRISFSDKQKALNDSAREIFPSLHRPIVNTSILTATDAYEYNLPTNFSNGELRKVYIQENTTNTIANQSWALMYGWHVQDDGTTKKLRLAAIQTNAVTLRLEGIAPLSTITNGLIDSMEVDGERVNLLIAYAKYKLYQSKGNPVASGDTGRYGSQSAEAYSEYMRLKSRLQMMKPASTMNIRTY